MHAWNRHRHQRGLDGVRIVTDTSNASIDALNNLCQARRRQDGELSWPAVALVDRAAGRREQVDVGDRVCFIRPYRTEDGGRVANGTAGTVVHIDLGLRRVTVACDDGRQAPVELEGREWAQPLRLGYAGHALRLQGGQAQVVLVVPGSWQTSRQSAYSMATRCVEELHVFVDRDSQCTGEYAQHEPLAASGTSAWLPEPADGRELGDGLGVELEFE